MKNTLNNSATELWRSAKVQWIALALLALLSTINYRLSAAFAQGTAFTYQGRLNDGANPANGIYDLRFAIYDSSSAGTQLGSGITNTATTVSNGLFTVVLDFGNQFPGAGRWLEIGARTNGAAVFVELAPRQALTSTPYSIQSENAASATSAQSVLAGNITGTLTAGQLPSGIVTNGASSVSIAGAFTGNGSGLTNVPGTSPWQVVAGTNVAAAANRSYLLTNGSTTAVTLPTTANVGDVVTVSGDGSNWDALAGAGQVIGQYSATNWTDNNDAPAASWQSVASSADGTKLVAVVNGGQIYTSSDSGLNWSAANNAPSDFWTSVASSADGVKLVAVAIGQGDGLIYTSTNSGATWSTNNDAPVGGWVSVASSADGTKLVAAAFQKKSKGGGGNNVNQIYTSIDSGATWVDSTNAGANDWTAVASSSGGARLVAVAGGGQIFTSVDSGATWSTNNNFSETWISVATSADGTKLVAAASGSPIYSSADSGATWSADSNSPPANWTSVASSADGSKLVAVTSGGGIYTSPDSGVTWLTNNDAPAAGWQTVASSADGGKLVAAISGGQLWISDAEYPGMAGTTTQFQYVGNGAWQPAGVPASQITGVLPSADLPANVVTNGENGVTFSGTFSGAFSGDGSGLMNIALLAGGNNFTGSQTITSGNVGIGTTSPNYPLSFQSVLGDKIALWDDGNGQTYGFGIQADELQIHADNTSSDVVIGSGSSAGFTETMRVKGSGKVGIGTTSPQQLLQVGDSTVLGSQGMIRVASRANGGSGARSWDFGCPIDAANANDTSGKNFSFAIQDTASTAPNFLIRWDTHWVGIGCTNPINLLTVGGGASPAYCDGTTWVSVSDRNAKEDFAPVDAQEVLAKVAALPLTEWQYKTAPGQAHLGPMAQDFHAAFGLNGSDDEHIATLDEDGVALAAIQGLNEKVEGRSHKAEDRIQKLEAENAELKARLEKLERMMER